MRAPLLDTHLPPGYNPTASHHGRVRKWLSGRASPCQGEGRGFESRLPLPFPYPRPVRGHAGQSARFLLLHQRPTGMVNRSYTRTWRNGRRRGLKNRWRETSVRVRVPPSAPNIRIKTRKTRDRQMSCPRPRLVLTPISTPKSPPIPQLGAENGVHCLRRLLVHHRYEV